MPTQYIRDVLSKEGLIEHEKSIYTAYNEPHRYYHNKKHLLTLVTDIINLPDLSQHVKNDLVIIACFHDFHYNPKGKENENLSRLAFISAVENNPKFNLDRKTRIAEAIMDTAERKCPTENVSSIFWKLDNKILDAYIDELDEYEKLIYKEFQFAPWPEYKKARLEFLEKEFVRNGNMDILDLRCIIRNKVPNVGIYPGSFNKFHIGHLNILEKAERVFDKVIIVRAINPEKDVKEYYPLPRKVANREYIQWSGLTTDLIQDLSKHSNVTLIRGLRNGKDLDYEVNQLRTMEDMYPKINACYFQCDKQYEHISSSQIKNVEKFGEKYTRSYLLE